MLAKCFIEWKYFDSKNENSFKCNAIAFHWPLYTVESGPGSIETIIFSQKIVVVSIVGICFYITQSNKPFLPIFILPFYGHAKMFGINSPVIRARLIVQLIGLSVVNELDSSLAVRRFY